MAKRLNLELITYGLKGLAAYTEHAYNLDHENKELYKFMQDALVATTDDTLTADQLRTGIRNSILSYKTTYLDKFDSKFILSKVQDTVDATDSNSIIGSKIIVPEPTIHILFSVFVQ